MLRGVQRRALRHGVLGGSGLWTTVWVVTVGIRLLRRLRSPRPELLFSRRVSPGEAFVVRGVAPEADTRRRRRRLRRAG